MTRTHQVLAALAAAAVLAGFVTVDRALADDDPLVHAPGPPAVLVTDQCEIITLTDDRSTT